MRRLLSWCLNLTTEPQKSTSDLARSLLLLFLLIRLLLLLLLLLLLVLLVLLLLSVVLAELLPRHVCLGEVLLSTRLLALVGLALSVSGMRLAGGSRRRNLAGDRLLRRKMTKVHFVIDLREERLEREILVKHLLVVLELCTNHSMDVLVLAGHMKLRVVLEFLEFLEDDGSSSDQEGVQWDTNADVGMVPNLLTAVVMSEERTQVDATGGGTHSRARNMTGKNCFPQTFLKEWRIPWDKLSNLWKALPLLVLWHATTIRIKRVTMP